MIVISLHWAAMFCLLRTFNVTFLLDSVRMTRKLLSVSYWIVGYLPFSHLPRFSQCCVCMFLTDDLLWGFCLQSSDWCRQLQCFLLRPSTPNCHCLQLSATVTPPFHPLVTLLAKKWINVSLKESHKANHSSKHESDSYQNGHLQHLSERRKRLNTLTTHRRLTKLSHSGADVQAHVSNNRQPTDPWMCIGNVIPSHMFSAGPSPMVFSCHWFSQGIPCWGNNRAAKMYKTSSQQVYATILCLQSKCLN